MTHAAQTNLTLAAAGALAGSDNVDGNITPSMAGEDFAFLLRERPGAFMFIGNGTAGADGTLHALHTPGYDFNDRILTLGAAYWVQLARMECHGR